MIPFWSGGQIVSYPYVWITDLCTHRGWRKRKFFANIPISYEEKKAEKPKKNTEGANLN